MEIKDMRRCLLICADMQTYSRMHVEAQYRAQRQFNLALTEAARHAGLDGDGWTTQNSGDGRLAILPPDTFESAIVGPMAHRMDELLREFNRDLRDEVRVRVRMAVHEGIVHTGDNGFPSAAVNMMSHMRDSDVVRAALAAFPDAGLALLVTDRIYDDIVEQGYDGIRKDRFRRVVIRLKHGREAVGWVSVLNEDVGRVRLPGYDDAAAGEPAVDGVPTAAASPTGTEPVTREPAAVKAKARPDRRGAAPSSDADTSGYHFGRVDSSGAMSFGPDSTANVYRRAGE